MDTSLPIAALQQREIDFYGDQIVAALVPVEGQPQPAIYVPVRPICEYLGLDWSSQRQRIDRDPVLSEVRQGVVITTAPSADGRGGGPQEMLCLPVQFLHGWLFGISASRIKAELQEKVIRYQRECYGALWRVFQAESLVALGLQRETSSLSYVRNMALAIAQMAEQQMTFELRLGDSDARLDRTEARLDQAAQVVGALVRDVAEVKRRVAPGMYIGDEQASEIQLRVKGLAQLLGQHDGAKNHYQGVFGTLYRTFGVTSYKNIPQARYAEVLTLLEEWRQDVAAGLDHQEKRASQST